MMRTVAYAFGLTLAASGAHAPQSRAAAQAFPTKTIRMLVPNAPGGGLDIIGRILSTKLSENLKQSVVVDNRPGASGSIALETVARAAPDGYTIGMMSSSQVINAALTKTSYDLFRDFAPVTQASASPYVLVVSIGVPAANIADLVEHAKANPGKLNYVSAGNGTLQHLATELFASNAGIKLSHVPYKGVGAALPDLLSNRVQMTMSSVTSLIAHIRSKGLRPLAVTSAQRVKDLPDVPTMVEAGYRTFVVTQWHGVIAPRATPPMLVERLQRELRTVVQHADVISRLEKDGTDPVGSTPQAFAALLRQEHTKWSAVIRQTGIRVE
ncbi:MAG TPA: tripartite tricarboxylate transporter substrate binding protein [Burkholderiales bacterium]|nr:tripartite tricarboxylate transporter substrate binding protein [Burkholderiales bacterium]